jgi:ABC-type bacteriocin/lantibiotic exporter with double-glycine peptidase domain
MTKFLFTLLSTALVSEEELRFTHNYKQGYDTSCGIAVTASLLTKYWNIPVSEADLYQNLIVDRASDEQVTYTVSFLDIADCLKQYQVQSRAYRMDWEALDDTLSKGFTPIIIHYEEPNPHFALLLGLEPQYALVADPAVGINLVDKKTFTQNYSGNALLAASRTAVKDGDYIKTVTSAETKRLNRLQSLALQRGRLR